MWVQKRRRRLRGGKGLKIGQNLSTAMSKKLLTSFMDGSYLKILYWTEFLLWNPINWHRKENSSFLFYYLFFSFNSMEKKFISSFWFDGILCHFFLLQLFKLTHLDSTLIGCCSIFVESTWKGLIFQNPDRINRWYAKYNSWKKQKIR